MSYWFQPALDGLRTVQEHCVAAIQVVGGVGTWLGDAALKASIGAALTMIIGALVVIPSLKTEIESIKENVIDIKGTLKNELSIIRAEQQRFDDKIADNTKTNAAQEAVLHEKEKQDEHQKVELRRQIEELRVLIRSKKMGF